MSSFKLMPVPELSRCSLMCEINEMKMKMKNINKLIGYLVSFLTEIDLLITVCFKDHLEFSFLISKHILYTSSSKHRAN